MMPLHYMRCWECSSQTHCINNEDVIGGFAARAPDHRAAVGEGTLHWDLQRSTGSAPEEARVPGSYAASAIRR